MAPRATRATKAPISALKAAALAALFIPLTAAPLATAGAGEWQAEWQPRQYAQATNGTGPRARILQLEANNASLRREINRLTRENDDLRAQRRDLVETRTALGERIEQRNERIDRLERQVANAGQGAERRIKRLRGELADSEKAREEAETVAERRADRIDFLLDQRSELVAIAEQRGARVSHLLDRREALEDKVERRGERIDRLSETQLRERVVRLVDARERKDARIAELEATVARLRKRMDDARTGR